MVGVYRLKELVEIIDKVWDSSFSIEKKFVVLTGGEPLLQVDEKLVRTLKDFKYNVALETNGTINTMIDFDWICVSPKDPKNWKLKRGDELKVVYPQNKFNLKRLLKLNLNIFFYNLKMISLPG